MSMPTDSRIYVAGHRGLVGSAIMRRLQSTAYTNLITRTHAELDLTDQLSVRKFFDQENPEYIFLAAARVGGILANSTYPADFIYENLAIQNNVIEESHRCKVKRLLFLGSSCIYPRNCPQPIKEEYLLTGPLEPTNRAYAMAKIAGIEMCWSFNRQHGTRFLSVMPTNLYGAGDNYDLKTSHVIPALIRKFHEAKTNGSREVIIWGTGKPMREFLFSDDMADACVFLMKLQAQGFDDLLGSDEGKSGRFEPPLVNIGVGEDISIGDLASLLREIVGFDGRIVFDASKPDGTPRKLLDVSKLNSRGWRASTDLRTGLASAYADFMALQKSSTADGQPAV
jgi:GDP-L-fucose synthase